ncbi:hypothetical protein P692DRAFT_20442905 [Suillus brevipes Sb2]|nr:hypothetical protein P692DRAFT_20442905 [Suillus brevipes Sb2]
MISLSHHNFHATHSVSRTTSIHSKRSNLIHYGYYCPAEPERLVTGIQLLNFLPFNLRFRAFQGSSVHGLYYFFCTFEVADVFVHIADHDWLKARVVCQLFDPLVKAKLRELCDIHRVDLRVQLDSDGISVCAAATEYLDAFLFIFIFDHSSSFPPSLSLSRCGGRDMMQVRGHC